MLWVGTAIGLILIAAVAVLGLRRRGPKCRCEACGRGEAFQFRQLLSRVTTLFSFLSVLQIIVLRLCHEDESASISWT